MAAAAALTAALAISTVDGGNHWVQTWASMPQPTDPANMPPPPFVQESTVMADSTLRQTIHTSVGGSRVRLRFSNAFGGAPLPITSVAVALPAQGGAGVSAIEPDTSRPVTFSGRKWIDVPVGAQAVSDPVEFSFPSRSNVTVTIHLAAGQASQQITSHAGSRTTSHLLAGDHVAQADLPGATPTNHWFFLSGMEVWAKQSTAAVVMLGDSLTDGRGSTTNLNNRWPDLLSERLRNVAVLNESASGNQVLADNIFGPGALARLDRDVLAHSGVQWLVVFEGINDIGFSDPAESVQRKLFDDLTAAYDQIVVRAHARGIRVYGATLLPFGGFVFFDDAAGSHERTRQAVNEWIRTSGRFDGVVDFDAVARDPANPRQLLGTFDSGDHLHLNPDGYRALAESVPLGMFR